MLWPIVLLESGSPDSLATQRKLLGPPGPVPLRSLLEMQTLEAYHQSTYLTQETEF